MLNVISTRHVLKSLVKNMQQKFKGHEYTWPFFKNLEPPVCEATPLYIYLRPAPIGESFH